MQLKNLGNLEIAKNIIGSSADDFGVVSDAIKILTKESKIAALATSALSETQKAQILTSQGVSAEEIKAALATGTLSTAQNAATASTVGFGTAVKGLGASLKALAVAHPILTAIVGIGALAFGAAKAYDAWNVSLEEASEALSKSSEAYDEAASQLKSLKDELSTVNLQIDELNSKDSLSLIEDQELTKLKETSKELEYQVTLAKEKQRIAAEQALADTKSVYNAKVTSKFETPMSEEQIKRSKDVASRYGIVPDVPKNPVVFSASLKPAEELAYAIENAGKAQSEVNRLKEEYLKLSNNGATEEELTKTNKLIEEQETLLSTAKNRAYEMATTIENVRSAAQSVKDNGGTLGFDDEEILRQSTESIEVYQDFYNEINNIAEEIEAIQETISSPNTKLTLHDFISSEDNQKVIDSFQTVADKVRSALDSLAKNELSSSDVLTLVKELGLNIENINLTTFEGLQEELSRILELNYNNITDALGNISDYENPESIKELPDLLNQIMVSSSSLDVYGNKIESLSDDVDKLADDMSYLNSIIYTLNKEKVISGEEAAKLIRLYPQLRNSVIETADGYKIEIDVLEQLRTGVYNTSKAQIQSEIDKTRATISGTQERLKEYRKELFALERLQYFQSLDNPHQINDALVSFNQERIDELKAAIAALGEDLTSESASLDSLLKQLELVGSKDYGVSSSSTKKTTKSTKDYADAIDWISESLKTLERTVDSAETKLSNTNGYKAQIKAIDELIKAQKKLKAGYDVGADEYLKQYEKSLKDLPTSIRDGIRSKIESGGSFTIQDFIDTGVASGDTGSNEKIKKAIDESLDFYQKYLDLSDKSLQIGLDISTKETEKIEKKLERAKLNQSILEIELDTNLTHKERKKLINEEYKAKRKILELEILLAGTAKERKKLQAELNQLDEQNQVDKYEQYQNNKDNKISLVQNDIDDVQNKIDFLKSAGQTVTANLYNELIDLSKQEVELYKDKISYARQELATVGKNTDRYYELKKEIQDYQNSIADIKQQQVEWNKSILALPIEKLEKANKELQKSLDSLSKLRDDHDTAIEGVTNALEDQIDAQNELKDRAEEYYDGLIKNSQTELDLLQKTYDDKKRLYDLEQAQYDLERARNQKTNRIYREGKGFVYENNQNDIREGQQKVDEAYYNIKVSTLQEEIDRLQEQKEKELEIYDREIERLSGIKDMWSEIANQFEKINAANIATAMLGDNWLQKILSGDSTIFNNISKFYTGLEGQIFDVTKQVEKNEDTIEKCNELIEAYDGTYQSFMQTYAQISNLVSDTTTESNAMLNRIESTLSYADAWNETEDKIQYSFDEINSAERESYEQQAAIIDEMMVKFDEFVEYMSQFNETITTHIDDLKKKQNKLKKKVVKNVDEVTQKLDDFSLHLEEEIVTSIRKSIKKITNAHNTAKDNESTILQDRITNLNNFKEEFKKVAQECQDAVSSIDSLISSANSKVSTVEGVVNSAKSSLGATGRASISNISSVPFSTHHSGVLAGKMGSDNTVSNAEQAFIALAKQPLKPNEVLVKALNGEFGITPPQIENLVGNFQNGLSYVTPKNDTTTPTTSITVQKMELHEVNDASRLSKEIVTNLAPALNQELHKK